MMTAHRTTVQTNDHARRVAQRRLSQTECRAWLSSHDEGRLSYLSGRGPRSVVVLYSLADRHIVMRLPDYHDAAHYAPGAEVHLDVEGVGEAGRDAVRVVGRAVLAGSAPMGVADDTGAGLDDGASTMVTSVVCLPISHIEGYETDPDHPE
jgi:hypothetical protein